MFNLKIKNKKNMLTNKKNCIIIFCFIVSALILMVTSKSSFLYPFNTWGDANAFFTMGKSLFNGKIIFKDIFEQKGPMLYLIYGIGYLISNTNFLGIFILEVLFGTVSLYYIYKIITLYLDKKYAYIILPIFWSIMCSTPAFASGGSCEEFTFPFIIYTIYQLLLYSRNDISNKKNYIVGIVTGIIFLMKYLMIGFSFSYILYVSILLLLKKEYKTLFKTLLYFTLGIFTALLPWIIYFIINDALFDFLNCYIIINALSYGVSNTSIIQKLINCIYFFARNLLGSGLHIFIIFCGIILYIIECKKVSLKEKAALFCSVIFSILFTYIGGTYLFYYILPLLIFIIFSFIGVGIHIRKDVKINKILYFVAVTFSVALSYFLTPNKVLLGIKKEELPQYKFAEIINKKEAPTILNYGALDLGFYTVADIIPNTKYFEKLNFKYEKYPQNLDSLNNYIEKKEVDFVVFVKKRKHSFVPSEYLNINYEKVAEYKNDRVDKDYDYYLYYKKETKEGNEL